MPLHQTSGNISAKGYGFGASTGATDGTVGIFAIGTTNGACSTAVRNKYTFSSCTSTACGVGSASVGALYGSAAGNSTRGIFALGRTTGIQSTGTIIRNKYTYSSCASTAIGVGTASIASSNGAGVGNSTRGIFHLGSSTTGSTKVRNKYTYSSCTSTASGVASASRGGYQPMAAGTSTIGYIYLGCSGCSCIPSNVMNKYTYSNCTSTSLTVFCGYQNNGAAGNSTRGIFANNSTCGGFSAVRSKFTYASCTYVSGTNASVGSRYGYATGNSTRGIFALGACVCRNSGSTIRNKYTYASCTSTASGVAASSCNSELGAAVSWSLCVNS
jgi:hypothetical protein